MLVGRLRIQADGYGRQEGDGRDGREEETRRDAGAKVWQRVLRSSRARPDRRSRLPKLPGLACFLALLSFAPGSGSPAGWGLATRYHGNSKLA